MIDFESEVKAVQRGDKEALKVFVELKEYIKYLKEKLEDIENIAIEEARSYGNSFKYSDFDITVVEGRKSYDYSQIEEWKDKKNELKKLEEKYKNALNDDFFSVDKNTGECIKAPIVKYSKSYLSIKNLK